MKAVQFAKYGNPEVLQVAKQVAKPTPGERQLLIRVKASGVNPLDTFIRAGQSAEVALPHTTGFDAAGIVEAVGPGVEKYTPGERVYTLKTVTGSCAEFTVTSEEYVGHLDDALSFEEGACIGIPYYTAYKSLVILARAKAGDNVLIHGASGGVGMAATQLAKAKGMKVFGTASTEEGLEFAKSNGCIETFNHKATDYSTKLMEEIGGRGFDVIIEMAAHVNMSRDMELMCRNGRTIIVGSKGGVRIHPSDTMGKESWFRGISILRSTPDELAEMRVAIEDGQRTGWVTPKVDISFPMEKADEAHKHFKTRKGSKGKVVITI